MRKRVVSLFAFVMVIALLVGMLPAITPRVSAEEVSDSEQQTETTDGVLYLRLLGADRYDAKGNASYDMPAMVGQECTISIDNGYLGNLQTNGQLTLQWQRWNSATNGYVDIAGQTGIVYSTVVTEEMLQIPDAVRCVATATDHADIITLHAGFTFTDTIEIYDTAEELIQALRDQMVARKRFCAAACPVEIAPERNAVDIFKHTGKPKEGDYLANLTSRSELSADTVERDGVTYRIFRVKASYYTTAEQERIVDVAIANALKQVRREDSYTSVLDIFFYICHNVTYDHVHFNDLLDRNVYQIKQTAYGALIDGTAVCEGFAQLFYRLCLEVGIDARVISGTIRGELHAWNIVDIDQNGTYYFVDVTNGVGFLGTRDPYDEGATYKRDSEFTSQAFIAQYPMPKDNYSLSIDYSVDGTTLTIHENIPNVFSDANVTTLQWPGVALSSIKTIIVDEGVTKLGNDSLRQFTNVREVQLPDSLEVIGDRVFYYNDELTKINLPQNLVSIGAEAFIQCDGLISITIPDSVETIGAKAFRWCDGITEIKFGENSRLKKIGEYAFDGTSIREIYLPDGVKEIAPGLLGVCRSLESVRMSPDVISIGEGAFAGCVLLKSIDIPKNVTRIENYTFQDCQALSEIVLPESITHIGDHAFYNCGEIRDIQLPDALEHIGKLAFRACRKISGNLNIPVTLKHIGDEAFALTAISSFFVAEKNPVYTAVDGVLFTKDKTELVAFPQEYFYDTTEYKYIVPEGTLRIGNRAFVNQERIRHIVLPEGLLEIGQQAFSGCIYLLTVEVSDSVIAIDAGAFSNCSELKAIQLPENLTELGTGAFSTCRTLKEIVIPVGVKTLSQSLFAGCSALEKITIPESVKTVEESAFVSCGALSTVCYGGSEKDWKAVVIENGNTCLTDQSIHYEKEDTTLPDGTGPEENENRVTVSFDGNGISLSLDAVTLETGALYGQLPVPEREGYTFSGWFTAPEEGALVTDNTAVGVAENHTLYAGWQPVTASGNFGNGFSWVLHTNGTLVLYGNGDMPDFDDYGATLAPWRAYANILQLKVEGKITNIGANAFWGCEDLQKVQLPDSVLRIEEGAFNICRGLKDIQLPKELQYIGDYAFRSVPIEQLVLPESLREMAPYAFAYCNGITEVTLPTSLITVGNAVFRECRNLRTVTFSGIPESIGIAIFRDCPMLQTVKLPDGLQSISTDMFYNCTGLKKIDLPDSIISIGNYAFYNAANLQQITMRGVQQIGPSAFANCASLENVTISGELKFIGNLAFSGCIRLQKAVVEKGVKTIGYGAFDGCASITELELPITLTSLAPRAFAGCAGLKQVQITADLVQIPEGAFAGCTALEMLQLSGTHQFVEKDAFVDCGALKEIYWPHTQESWNAVQIRANNEALLSATVFCSGGGEPVAVTVTLNALGGTVDQNSLTVTYGGIYGLLPTPQKENAFFRGWYTAEYGGTKVSEQTRVERADAHTLYARWVEQEASGQCGDDLFWALYSNGDLRISGTGDMWELSTYSWESVKQYVRSVCFEKGVTSIGSQAFMNCASLKYVTIPDTVKKIGDLAFYMSGVLEVTVPESVTEIGDSVFAYSSIQDATVSTTGTKMFYECRELETVKITGHPVEIAANAFYCTLALTEINIPESVVMINDSAFERSQVSGLDLPDGLLHIGARAFAGMQNITTLDLPDGLQSIGKAAFSGSWVEKMVIPESVTTMGNRIFYSCSKLKDIRFKNDFTELPEEMFSFCDALENVELPASLKVIKRRAFSSTKALKKIQIPEGVTTIEVYAFYGSGLVSVEIPSSVTTLSGFNDCTSLITVTLNEGLTVVEQLAFMNCTALKSITIPSTVKTIGYRMFYGATGLKEIIFLGDAPEQYVQTNWITSGDTAFYNVTATIYYPEDNDTWSEEDWQSHGGNVTWQSWYTLGNVSACNHSLTQTQVGATCEDGYTLYSCACGYSRRSDFVSGSGHSFSGACDTSCNNAGCTFLRETTAAHTYGENSDQCSVCGYTRQIQGIAIQTAPEKKEYIQGVEVLDLSGGQLLVTYTDGTTQTVSLTKDMVTGFDNTALGTCMLTVTYQTVTTSLDVEIIRATITFVNEDGTLISSTQYAYGESVAVPEAPVKAQDNTYTYTFAGWDKEVVNCAGNATYQAVFHAVFIEYTIIFQYADGTPIAVLQHHYNDQVMAPETVSPEEEGYIFAGWDKTVTACKGDAVYTAVFQKTYTAGDLTGDGKINSLDGLMLMRHLNGWTLDIPSEDAMDVNADGKVNSLDGLLLMRYLNGWDVTLG